MTLRNTKPFSWNPKGVSDTIDGALGFNGCMLKLTNLIPDPGSNGVWVCRPAALLLTSFGGFNTPGFISVLKIIGTKAYGMVVSSRNIGNEEPFIYDIVSGLFKSISGITSVNTPVASSVSGSWVPPTIDQIGSKLIFTHQGFNSVGGFFIGTLDISNPAAPTWMAGNLTGAITFSTKPTAVAQFNGRAWYAVGNSIVFSDTTNPTTCTLGTQALTIGFNVNINALVGLPLNSLTGGITQSLMAFVGTANNTAAIYQIVGDAASISSPLVLNQLNVATGTYTQNSVTPTPQGLCFVSPEGLRFINFNAQISDPIGVAGQGVVNPFYYSLFPSRVQIAYAGDVIRVTSQNGKVPGAPQQEFFYHMSRKQWSGPHTFPASMVEGYGSAFIMAPVGVTGSLWQSNAVPGLTNTYIENGSPMFWTYQTPLLPDTIPMQEFNVLETTINMAKNLVDQYNFAYLDVNLSTINSVLVQGAGAASVWGGFNWGNALWLGAPQSYAPVPLNFTTPVVFKRTSFLGFGSSSDNFRVGGLDIRMEGLGYLMMEGVVPPVLTGQVVLKGVFTLAVNQQTTTVIQPSCLTTSVVEATANTNSARQNPISIVPGNGQFVVTHGANAAADQTFLYTLTV